MDSSSPSTRRPLLWGLAVTFLLAMAILGWGLSRQRVAAAYSDPIAHIRAQDESEYVNASVEMATHGGWLTPRFLGRFYLLKPPLLMWATALSLRTLGETPLAIRFPALLLGVLGCCVAFLWVAKARSPAAGALAAGLLMLNPLWGLLSRLCYTDTLAASFSGLALLWPALDPSLDRRRTRLLFGFFAGAAVLDKGIAGLIPCLALILYACLRRPGFLKIAESLTVAALVAAPWHLYQLVVHHDWFLAEYVQTQIVASGVFGTEAGIFNRPAFFYLQRLVQLDPFLTVFALLAVGGVIQVLRKRDNPAALLATCWLLTSATALALFQVRNLPYLALALPPLAIVSGLCGGAWIEKFALFRTALLLGIILLIVSIVPHQSWSLRENSAPLPGAEAIRMYAASERGRELIDVSPDDEYYSTTIPLTKVRYIYLDPSGSVARSAPYTAFLGITLTSSQFMDLPYLKPEFEARLRQWGLDSSEPIGSTITLQAIADLEAVIASHPASDFYLDESWLPPSGRWQQTHLLQRVHPGRVFLLSKSTEPQNTVAVTLPSW